MTEEESILAHIEAEPLVDLHQKVYCDWLYDNGRQIEADIRRAGFVGLSIAVNKGPILGEYMLQDRRRRGELPPVAIVSCDGVLSFQLCGHDFQNVADYMTSRMLRMVKVSPPAQFGQFNIPYQHQSLTLFGSIIACSVDQSRWGDNQIRFCTDGPFRLWQPGREIVFDEAGQPTTFAAELRLSCLRR